MLKIMGRFTVGVTGEQPKGGTGEPRSKIRFRLQSLKHRHPPEWSRTRGRQRESQERVRDSMMRERGKESESEGKIPRLNQWERVKESV